MFPRRWGPLAGLVVLLSTHAVILGRVAWNRALPIQVCTLTERELAMPFFEEPDSSSLFLQLRLGDQPPPEAVWAGRMLNVPLYPEGHPWLDRGKLQALGFRVGVAPDAEDAPSYYAGPITRRAFVALEMEGRAWERFLAERQEQVARVRSGIAAGVSGARELRDAEALLALDMASRSRLMPVDADRDGEVLVRRYPGASHLVIPCGITLQLTRSREGRALLATRIEPLVSSIQVELPHRGVLVPLMSKVSREAFFSRLRSRPAWPEPRPARYCIHLAYGRTWEPWIRGLSGSTSAGAAPSPE